MRLESPLRFKTGDKIAEGKTSGTDGELGARILTEKTSCSIDTMFTDVDVLFNSIDRATLGKSSGIENPTTASNGPDRDGFLKG